MNPNPPTTSPLGAGFKWAFLGVILSLVAAAIVQSMGIRDFQSAALLYAPGGFIGGFLVGWKKSQ
ncbi:MAG: hypothetical protein L3J39_04565 [Verrucomicrobiales bacterium]|nr:hypothetical protein [Verrucomicrobiales bacterium]